LRIPLLQIPLKYDRRKQWSFLTGREAQNLIKAVIFATCTSCDRCTMAALDAIVHVTP
jgi:hypothetical protein